MSVVTVSSYADFVTLIGAFAAAPDPIAYYTGTGDAVEAAVAFTPYALVYMPRVPDAPSEATFQAAFTTEVELVKQFFVSPK